MGICRIFIYVVHVGARRADPRGLVWEMKVPKKVQGQCSSDGLEGEASKKTRAWGIASRS